MTFDLQVILGQTLRMALPYAFASLGGVLSERSGVPNIALEGAMLSGAFAYAVFALSFHSVTVAFLCALLVGCGLGALHALLTVFYKVNAIVSGIAMNLLAFAGTRFLLRFLFHSSSNSPSILGDNHGEAFFVALLALLTVLSVLMSWGFKNTKYGLWIRAAGESPSVLHSAHVPLHKVRFWAVTLGCGLCALGGVSLVSELHQFQSGMSGGRGYIALATVILGGWRFAPALCACFLFAFLDALQLNLQTREVHFWLFDMLPALPYFSCLLLLFVFGKKLASYTPKALGKDEELRF